MMMKIKKILKIKYLHKKKYTLDTRGLLLSYSHVLLLVFGAATIVASAIIMVILKLTHKEDLPIAKNKIDDPLEFSEFDEITL